MITNASELTQFPVKTLTKFPTDERPNAFHVRLLKKELCTNAMSVHSSLGGGRYGHLGLVLPNAEYVALPNAAAFVIPNRPAVPALAGGAGAAAAVNAQTNYSNNLKTYETCATVIANLRAQILEAVPKVYIETLEHEMFGFNTTSVRDILAHLVTTYGTITPEDLERNMEKLSAPWNPDTTIEAHFSNATKLRAFATAGNEAIPDTVAVRALLKSFKLSGVMDEGLKDWYKKPTADQTWANMATHFTTANKEGLRNLTTSQAGFNTAHAAQTKDTKQPVKGNTTIPYC